MASENVSAKQILKDARWNSLKLYNGYRIFIAFTLLLSHGFLKKLGDFNIDTVQLIFAITFGYLIFSLASAILTWLEKPKLEFALPTQIITDIVFILLLMYLEKTSNNGFGLLLIITIAAASLISDGRLALFYAALATIGILVGQFFTSVFLPEATDSYTRAAMLSAACFAIAWLAHSLATRMQQSEALASQRSHDLQNMEQVNALIAHKIEDGVLVIDQDLVIKHHNIQAQSFINLEVGDWLNKRLDDISPELTQLYFDWLKSKDNQTTNELNQPKINKINVSSRELKVSFLPVSDTADQGAVVFVEDWSQMQTQSHQVKLAALGRLTANIAHEIRNPLSAIGHANQLLQEDEEISPANMRMLQIISDNVQRLDQIIKDVLELNRRDRTNQEIIHLENFITDFYNQFCVVENISSDDFRLKMENHNTSVLFDRRHLNQILWNLCKNGWRHSLQSDSSVVLDIHLSQPSHVITIEVSNDGEPIPDSISSHLFEPFFTTEETGTGLGLYISRELAEANGANLKHIPSNDRTKFVMLLKKATI